MATSSPAMINSRRELMASMYDISPSLTCRLTSTQQKQGGKGNKKNA
jgi:hypothetical protein